MKAVVLSAERPRLDLVELPDPRPGPADVVVRVTGCGVCGSDLHVATSFGQTGSVLGHEIAGVVAATGRDVGHIAPGQVVAARPFVGCGHCRFCAAERQDHCDAFEFIGTHRPGGFAEYTIVPASEVFPLPAEVRPQDQPLVEPFAVARRALRRSRLVPEESVIVLGAGPIGLAVTHWARALGAGRVVVSDPVAERRSLALTLGAGIAVDPDEIVDVAGDGGALVVECTGRPGVIDQAMRLAAIDGRVTVVGICLRPDTIAPWSGLQKELDLRFSLYYGRDDFLDTIDGFASGALSPDGLVAETVSLDGLPERFSRLEHDQGIGKIVVRP